MLYLGSGRELRIGEGCVCTCVRRGGVVENEARRWGGPRKRIICGRPYMPLVLSLRPVFAKMHAMED